MKLLWRYYQAGIVNTFFGYGMYAALIWAGLGMYAAQLVAHLVGTGFNYLTYSRHTFAGLDAVKSRFVLSYVFNYSLGLASLAAASLVIASPYVAGILSILFVSLVNFFVLKTMVFTKRAAD
jgi:hypothetical protein